MQHRELIDAVEAHDLVRMQRAILQYFQSIRQRLQQKEGMMQTNGLNIALISCGFFGVQLASAFDKAQANLIAVTDINPSLAQKLADQYGSQAFFSVEEMLAKTKPDLVVIATPNYAHYSPAILALNAGCHVFIETPFTLSASQGPNIYAVLLKKKVKSFLWAIWNVRYLAC